MLWGGDGQERVFGNKSRSQLGEAKLRHTESGQILQSFGLSAARNSLAPSVFRTSAGVSQARRSCFMP